MTNVSSPVIVRDERARSGARQPRPEGEWGWPRRIRPVRCRRDAWRAYRFYVRAIPSEIVRRRNTSPAATPSIHPARPEAGFGARPQKSSAVSVVLENRLATVTRVHHLLNGSRIFDAESWRLTRRNREAPERVNVNSTIAGTEPD